MSHFTRFALSAALLALVPACSAPGIKGSATDASKPAPSDDAKKAQNGDEKKEKEQEKKKDPAEHAAKVAKKKHEIAIAELELQIARMKNEDAERDVQIAMQKAERELTDARTALQIYRDVESTIAAEQRTLSVDRSRGRMEDDQAELAELEAMYAQEDFAQSTKEIVLTRGRRSLEHSRRALQIDEAEAQLEKTHEHPKKLRDLERAAEKAERELAKTRRDAELGTLERRVKLEKAEFGLSELQRELEKLEKEGAEGAEGAKDGEGEPEA